MTEDKKVVEFKPASSKQAWALTGIIVGVMAGLHSLFVVYFLPSIMEKVGEKVDAKIALIDPVAKPYFMAQVSALTLQIDKLATKEGLGHISEKMDDMEKALSHRIQMVEDRMRDLEKRGNGK